MVLCDQVLLWMPTYKVCSCWQHSINLHRKLSVSLTEEVFNECTMKLPERVLDPNWIQHEVWIATVLFYTIWFWMMQDKYTSTVQSSLNRGYRGSGRTFWRCTERTYLRHRMSSHRFVFLNSKLCGIKSWRCDLNRLWMLELLQWGLM